LPEPDLAGSVLIFTGNGKGKTTAAIGAAVRASGHGLKSLMVLFMKGSGFCHGEITALSQIPEIAVKNFGHEGWVDKNNIRPEDIKEAKAALQYSREAILSNQYDLVILDEIHPAIECGLVEYNDILDIIKNRPFKVSLILTGRNADKRLFEYCDVVTQMSMIKHQYGQGINARKGLDY